MSYMSKSSFIFNWIRTLIFRVGSAQFLSLLKENHLRYCPAKKEGRVKRGTNRLVCYFYFFHIHRCFLGTLKVLLSCFKFEKTGYSVYGPKMWSLFNVECFIKTSEVWKEIGLQRMWRYSLCRHLSCNAMTWVWWLICSRTVFRRSWSNFTQNKKRYFSISQLHFNFKKI